MSSRADISMNPEEIERYFESARTMILSTIGPDGVPDPVGMWFVLRDGDIWMRTYASSQKARNVERDPRVAILVEDGDSYTELKGVQITGTLEISRDEDLICDIAASLLVKYEGLAPEHEAAAREAYRSKAPKQVALRLIALRTVSWDHRKMVSNQ